MGEGQEEGKAFFLSDTCSSVMDRQQRQEMNRNGTHKACAPPCGGRQGCGREQRKRVWV